MSPQPAPVTDAGAPLTSLGETLADFLEDLADETGDRDDMTPARYKKAVNRAYRNLAGMIRIKELEASLTLSLESGYDSYYIPQQVSFIQRISLIDSQMITGGTLTAMTDPQAFRELPDCDGTPTTYIRVGRVVYFWPTPNDDWDATMDFKVRPDDLVNDTDSPILPIEMHEPLMLMAKARVWRLARNYKEASQAMNDALGVLRPLLNTDAEELDGAEFSLAPARKWSQMRGTKEIGR